MSTLGEQAREHRRALRLTQRELATLAMVSERFVRDFEANKPTVQLNKVIDVLSVLGLDLTLTHRAPER